MKTLLELYSPTLYEAPVGRTLDMQEFPDDIKVAWDKAAKKHGVGAATFLQRGNRIYANTRGTGWFEWDGTEWRRTEKPSGPNAADVSNDPLRRGRRYPKRHDDNRRKRTFQFWNVFSNNFAGYKNNIIGACRRMFGKNFDRLIDDANGPGSTERFINELWHNFWTDHEALNEMAHRYDIAQNDDVDAYMPNIGPAWDPGNYGVERTERVLSADHFDY